MKVEISATKRLEQRTTAASVREWMMELCKMPYPSPARVSMAARWVGYFMDDAEALAYRNRSAAQSEVTA